MKEDVIAYLKSLRESIISSFEHLDPMARFKREPWTYSKGEGGGEIGIARHGNYFEKGAVNFSAVAGDQFPGDDGRGPFFATGVSLITHMFNPHAPTVHFNLRYIETPEKSWFGGGYDLTPMGFPYPEDTQHFHRVAQESLDPFDATLYPQFSENARRYFYIPHREKERGIGGIFFDHYNSGNLESDFLLWKAIGNSFLDTILPIYQRRIHTPYDENDKSIQLQMRAHYVEFNLLYDRGTKFGFLSGGNPNAILCSLPPLAAW
ncbi:MAG: oxygen-dependent coproporphyrinogen oxidase [Chlamydiales bacterium]